MRKRFILTLYLLSVCISSIKGFHYNGSTEEINFTYNGSLREGKFLFDSLFGLELDDISSDTNVLKSCDCVCGRQNQEIRIVGGKPAGEFQIIYKDGCIYIGLL